MFEIYVVTNLLNGRTYVGKAANTLERWTQHVRESRRAKPSCRAFHAAIREFGASAFSVSVVARCATEPEAFDLERSWIARLDSKRNGYNLTVGGQGSAGVRFTAEAKQRLSAMRKGRPGRKMTSQGKAKISEANRGREKSEETRQRLRDGLRERRESGGEWRRATQTGKILSPERRMQIAEMNRSRNDASRAKTGQAMRALIAAGLRKPPSFA